MDRKLLQYAPVNLRGESASTASAVVRTLKADSLLVPSSKAEDL
jgi:hypothetical protein